MLVLLVFLYNGKEKFLAVYGNGIAGCEVAFNTLKKYTNNIMTHKSIHIFYRIIK
jgi:hypothetical protein